MSTPKCVKIYCLKDPITEEIRYIGKTVQKLRCRLASHYTRNRNIKNHTEAWIHSLKSKGLKPIMELIEEVNDSIWIEKEQYYIKYYKDNGYNLTNHSIGGDTSNLGCRWIVEDKSNIRKLKGINVLVFDIDLNFIEELESVVDFYEKYNVAEQNVYRRIDKGLPIKKMLIYRKDKFKKAELKSKKILNNPVLVYDLNNILLYEFENTIDASRYLKIDNSTISKFIKSGKLHKRRKLTFKNKYCYGC